MRMYGYSSQTIHDIAEHINMELVSYYDANSKNKYYTQPLLDLIRQIIEEDIHSETDETELRRIYNSKRRIFVQKKRRQYENCKKMVEARTWETDDIDRYCFKSDVLNHSMFTPEQWDTVYSGKTFEEVQLDRLSEIENWYKDPNAPLIAYPGQERKTPRRQFDNFKADLLLEILATMKNLYNWDMENLTFPIMDDLTDKPVFTTRREVIGKTPGETKNSVVVFTSEDGRRRTVMTFDDAAFGDADKTTLFDYKDSSILTYLLRATIKYDGGTLPILIEKSKLIRATCNNPKRKLTKDDYDDIDNRLRKLSQVYIENYVDNEWVSTFHMVDAVEKQTIDSRKYIAFYPSEYMTTQIESDGISQLPSDLKNKLSSDAAKLFYAPLMLQRVKAYKKMRSNGSTNDYFEVNFHYGHFLRFVNFGNGNQQDNHKEIISILEEYKEKGIFIQDYRYTPKTRIYSLVFKPLTDIEIQDLSYYFGDEYAIDNMEFQQIDVFSFIEND